MLRSVRFAAQWSNVERHYVIRSSSGSGSISWCRSCVLGTHAFVVAEALSSLMEFLLLLLLWIALQIFKLQLQQSRSRASTGATPPPPNNPTTQHHSRRARRRNNAGRAKTLLVRDVVHNSFATVRTGLAAHYQQPAIAGDALKLNCTARQSFLSQKTGLRLPLFAGPVVTLTTTSLRSISARSRPIFQDQDAGLKTNTNSTPTVSNARNMYIMFRIITTLLSDDCCRWNWHLDDTFRRRNKSANRSNKRIRLNYCRNEDFPQYFWFISTRTIKLASKVSEFFNRLDWVVCHVDSLNICCIDKFVVVWILVLSQIISSPCRWPCFLVHETQSQQQNFQHLGRRRNIICIVSQWTFPT